MQVIKLPNGFFNKDHSVFINLEVRKSNPIRKNKVDNCGSILTPYGSKILYRVNFLNGSIAWNIN